MTRDLAARLFGPVMGWTAITSIFAWLPLVRILGRAEGYTWAVLGVSGSGTEGPFWIFGPLTAFVVGMLYAGFRGPRALFRPMLLLWHGAVTAVVIAGVVQGGSGATLQGQGLGFEIPLWVLAVPFGVVTVLAGVWAVADHRAGPHPPVPRWEQGNTRRLAVSLVFLGAALLLFRAGTNYNRVTAAAILATVAHWITLVQSFAYAPSGSRQPDSRQPDAGGGGPA